MAWSRGAGHPYEALWIINCDCGEIRISWGPGFEGQWFSLNYKHAHKRCYDANLMEHDDLPRSWFCAGLADAQSDRKTFA